MTLFHYVWRHWQLTVLRVTPAPAITLQQEFRVWSVLGMVMIIALTSAEIRRERPGASSRQGPRCPGFRWRHHVLTVIHAQPGLPSPPRRSLLRRQNDGRVYDQPVFRGVVANQSC